MSLVRRRPGPRTAGPYRESVTLQIVGRALFAPGDLEGGRAVKVRAMATAEQAMKPLKVIVCAHLTATHGANGLVDCEVDGLDMGLMLLGASFGGRDAVLPQTKLSTFANSSLGSGISFPVVEAGAEVCMDFGITKEILCHLPPAPDGYDPIPKSISIKIEMMIYGEPLRPKP